MYFRRALVLVLCMLALTGCEVVPHIPFLVSFGMDAVDAVRCQRVAEAFARDEQAMSNDDIELLFRCVDTALVVQQLRRKPPYRSREE